MSNDELERDVAEGQLYHMMATADMITKDGQITTEALKLPYAPNIIEREKGFDHWVKRLSTAEIHEIKSAIKRARKAEHEQDLPE